MAPDIIVCVCAYIPFCSAGRHNENPRERVKEDELTSGDNMVQGKGMDGGDSSAQHIGFGGNRKRRGDKYGARERRGTEVERILNGRTYRKGKEEGRGRWRRWWYGGVGGRVGGGRGEEEWETEKVCDKRKRKEEDTQDGWL